MEGGGGRGALRLGSICGGLALCELSLYEHAEQLGDLDSVDEADEGVKALRGGGRAGRREEERRGEQGGEEFGRAVIKVERTKTLKVAFHQRRTAIQWDAKQVRLHQSCQLTCVMFGANTIATLRDPILLMDSLWATSAMSCTTQSSRPASMAGRRATSCTACSSDSAAATSSGDRLSRRPEGRSRNHAWRRGKQKSRGRGVVGGGGENVREGERGGREFEAALAAATKTATTVIGAIPKPAAARILHYISSSIITSAALSSTPILTLMRPASECTSVLAGTWPTLTLFLSCIAPLLSPATRKIPSTWRAREKTWEGEEE